MEITYCKSCKSTKVEKIDTILVEKGYHYEEQLYYPWEEKLVKEYDYYKQFKCKDCGCEFKDRW